MAPSGPVGNLHVSAKYPERKRLEGLLIGCLLHDAFPDHYPAPLGEEKPLLAPSARSVGLLSAGGGRLGLGHRTAEGLCNG